MKKILVPTDFSECAEEAVKVAARIAKKTDARLYLLHVLDIPVYDRNDNFGTYTDTAEGIFWMKLVKKKFKELFAKPYLKGVNAVQVLQFHGVYATIADQAKEHDIDLIVMGSHGDSGVHEVFIGSNTEKVVRLAECPVLTVKPGMPDFEPKSIVFASNFLGEAADNFQALHEVMRIWDVKIHLVKVVTPDKFERTEKAMHLIESFAKEVGLKEYESHIVNEQSIEAGIIWISQKLDADVIAMETHGRTGLERFFRGSNAESVVNHAQRCVLTVKIKEPESTPHHLLDFLNA